MWRAALFLFALAALAATGIDAACPCMIRYGVCDETKQSDAVFVGTVESVAPPFLDPYQRAKAMAELPAGETARLQADSSPEAFEKLRAIYLRLFTGLPEAAKARIAAAISPRDLQSAFEETQSDGRLAHLRVRTIYKRPGEDDDDDAKADDAAAPEFLDIWTGAGDCGFDFQVGETYLVYAVQDEDSGRLGTSVCMRTRRLSEEKGDLAYLYFLETSKKESTRVEGFVSTSFRDQNLPRYEDAVTAPSAGSVVELDTGAGLRYTRTDAAGLFFFDGLKEGDYRLSLLQPGFPQAPRGAVISRSIHAGENACVRQILVWPSIAP